MYVSIGRLDSELLSNSMKVSRGGIIMKSHCCDADTYNRKVGLFLRNARVSFIMQSTVIEFVPLEPEPVELEPEVHPLAHLLLHPTTISVRPTPRPAPPDYHWTDDARFGRVVVDFMGSTGLRSNFY